MKTQSFQLISLPPIPAFIRTLNKWGFKGYVAYMVISMILAMILSRTLAEFWLDQSLTRGVILAAILIIPVLGFKWAWSRKVKKSPLTVLGNIEITPTDVRLEYEAKEDVVIPMSQIQRIDVYEKYPTSGTMNIVPAPFSLLPIRLIKITGPLGVLDCHVKVEPARKKEDHSLDLYLNEIKNLNVNLHRKIQMWEPGL